MNEIQDFKGLMIGRYDLFNHMKTWVFDSEETMSQWF